MPKNPLSYDNITWSTFSITICHAGCTLSPRAFGEILEWELLETRLRVWLYTLALSSWFWSVTWGDSQARHETLWLGHQGPLKKRELMRRDTSAQGYTRASEARRVFPSTFSLLRCLGLTRRECTAHVKKMTRIRTKIKKPRFCFINARFRFHLNWDY